MTRKTRQALKRPGIRRILWPFTLALALLGFAAFSIAG